MSPVNFAQRVTAGAFLLTASSPCSRPDGKTSKARLLNLLQTYNMYTQRQRFTFAALRRYHCGSDPFNVQVLCLC